MSDARPVLTAIVLATLIACSAPPASLPGETAGAPSTGGAQASAGQSAAPGGAVGAGSGSTATGGSSSNGGGGSTSGGGAPLAQPGAQRPFPQRRFGQFCSYPLAADDGAAQAAYQTWKDVTVTADGAGGFLRVKKPDSGAIVGSTASEGIGYGMILAAYFGDQPLFDGLWGYEQLHLDDNGLMNWDIGPDGATSSAGMGAATDGDIDMAWALVMADQQWGGQGALAKTYLDYAKDLIERIWTYEVDHARGEMLMAGDKWGSVDVTNPSYFAPAYFRVFGKVTGRVDDWNKVIDANYVILAKSLNASSGNADNGLAPAWCDSSGKPVEAFAGAPTHFQNDATRVPFRIGQDYCYFGEPRAKQYLALISSFYAGVGVANIVDGYDLDGTPRPERAVGGLQAASFVGPAGVAGMSDATFRSLIDGAYAAVATQKLTAGTIYYQKSWTALSLLMLTGNLVDLTAE
jgi:endo-1,4-beta-D-glucanase Y